jgi:aryl-alcohol dehydrogenase-like predicted oxidoreductase
VLSLGTMHFGTATDEATSFAILDRYVEAGGTFIDTADSYGFWVGTQGGESEELLGRWRRSRGIGEEILIATKLGARPLAPGTSFTDNAEGLSARLAALREVAKEAGATVNQVVLAWLIGAEIPVIPLVGASSVTQLDESLAAVDLELTAEQRTRLDAAR